MVAWLLSGSMLATKVAPCISLQDPPKCLQLRALWQPSAEDEDDVMQKRQGDCAEQL